MQHSVLLVAPAGPASGWPVGPVRSIGLDNNGTSAARIADLDGGGLLRTVFVEVKQNNPNDSLRPM